MLVFKSSKLVDQNQSYDKMSKSRFTLVPSVFATGDEYLWTPPCTKYTTTFQTTYIL